MKIQQIAVRLTSGVLTFSLLCGCTLTERLGEVDQSFMIQENKQVDGELAIAYYVAEKVNPVTSVSEMNQVVCEAIYEGLFCLDDNFQPQPVLCESYQLEGTRCTLVLKDGLKFSDGTDVTASDVVFSYKLAKNTPNSRYQTRASYMKSIREIDRKTIQITLTAANSRFLSLLDIPIFKAGTQEEVFSIGTGPFAAQKNENIYELVPNPNWRGGNIAVEKIELLSTVRADAVVSSFASGDISLTRAERISDTPVTIQGAVDVYQTPTTEMHYLGVRMSHPLLGNAVFRRALSMAIDREMICKSALQTFADPAVLPISPQPDTIRDEGFGARLEEASALLASIGVVDQNADGRVEYNGQPVVLTLVCNAENNFKSNVCHQLATAFGQLGIRLIVQKLPFAQYQAVLQNGAFDLYYGDILLSPDFDMRPLLMTDGSLNYGRIVDIELDSKVMGIRTASAETLVAAEAAFQSYFLSNMPIIPLAFEKNQVILRSGLLTGYAPRPYQMFWAPEEWRYG